MWVKKDIGHWTIPKGELELGEEFVAAARREFAEETGHQAPNHPLIDLGQITQKSGKLVLGWAVEGDLDPSSAVSNTYEMEWPPHSGVVRTFPEIDRVEWFDLDEARRRLKAAQVPFLDRLQTALATAPGGGRFDRARLHSAPQAKPSPRAADQTGLCRRNPPVSNQARS